MVSMGKKHKNECFQKKTLNTKARNKVTNIPLNCNFYIK